MRTPQRISILFVSRNPRENNGLTVGEFGNQGQTSPHRLDGLPERGKQEIAALFEAGNTILANAEHIGHARLRELPRAPKLTALADGKLSFTEYNCFLAKQVLDWNICRDMGIFSECATPRLRLIDDKVRPSIETVAVFNAFPFKTISNADPLDGPLANDLWTELTLKMLKFLCPEIIVQYKKFPQRRRPALKALCPKTIIEVFHPSINSRTCPDRLSETWKPVSDALSRL